MMVHLLTPFFLVVGFRQHVCSVVFVFRFSLDALAKQPRSGQRALIPRAENTFRGSGPLLVRGGGVAHYILGRIRRPDLIFFALHGGSVGFPGIVTSFQVICIQVEFFVCVHYVCERGYFGHCAFFRGKFWGSTKCVQTSFRVALLASASAVSAS